MHARILILATLLIGAPVAHEIWGSPSSPTAESDDERSGLADLLTQQEQDLHGANPAARDFDFLIGRWEMRLFRPMDGEWRLYSTEISEVSETLRKTALLDYWDDSGFTVRTYDPRAKKWRLFWTDRGPFQGRIQFWEGEFENGVGTFIGGDWFPNPSNRLHSKIVFSEITDDEFLWEMYHTRDNGETWTKTDRREYRRLN